MQFFPGSEVNLADIDTRRVEGEWNKKSAREQIQRNVEACKELQVRLFAEDKRSLLLVLQGMDTAGKDGTIRSITTGINPQGFQVVSFKQPGYEELERGFLWRIHIKVPRRGNIGIFNRSHYEDVLVVRVRNLVQEAEWRSRYQRINDFEKLLTQAGTKILKCFLHISKEEQRERLQARLDNPEKTWKFSTSDLSERKLWDDYQQAYQDALNKCNTEHAPWHIIPSDRKWYRNLLVSELFRKALEEMDPQFPAAEDGLADVVVD